MDLSWEGARTLLEDLLSRYGLPFRIEVFWDRLWFYLKALSTKGESLNLTASRTMEAYLRSPVLESLILASCLPSGVYPLADLGTGGGIPGMILKLVRPELEVTLYEAYPPRVAFLRWMIEELSLSGIEAEICHLGKSWPERDFPVIVARGYGSVEKFTRHARKLLSPPGQAFYLWRNDIEPWGKETFLPLMEKIEFELPQGGSRSLLILGLS